jgi:hypothetical protein
MQSFVFLSEENSRFQPENSAFVGNAPQEQALGIFGVTLPAHAAERADPKAAEPIAQVTSVRFIWCLPTVRPALTVVSGDSGVSTI